MLLRKFRRSIPLWLLLLALPVTASAQRDGRPAAASTQQERRVSYLFVSPNTREGLSPFEALRKLDSGEEAALIAGARDLTRCLGLKAEIARALGSWSDGAEHMALIKTATDEATARYVNARLGMGARQKSVLYFSVHAGGGGKMYVLKVKPGGHDLTAVARHLDRSGIRYRTIIPGRRQVLVYVVDLDDKLGRSVNVAARRLGGQYDVLVGTGAFIGDGEDRESAQQVYREVVSGYEASRPRAEGVCGGAPGTPLARASDRTARGREDEEPTEGRQQPRRPARGLRGRAGVFTRARISSHPRQRGIAPQGAARARRRDSRLGDGLSQPRGRTLPRRGPMRSLSPDAP